MDPHKRARLEAAGWRFGSAEEFLISIGAQRAEGVGAGGTVGGEGAGGEGDDHGGFVGGIAAFANIESMLNLTNIGTLFAFMLVCIGIPILRYKDPQRPRPIHSSGFDQMRRHPPARPDQKCSGQSMLQPLCRS